MAIVKLHNPVLAENSKFGNFILEGLAVDPTLVGLQNAGRIWFNTTEKKFKGTFIDANGTSLETRTIGDSADVTVLDGRLTEVETQVNGNIGTLSNLTTTNKTNLVAAVNELDADLATEVADRIAADALKVDKINITAGTVGSVTQIPTINYNEQGQITSVSSNEIQIDLQGVTDLGNTSTNGITLSNEANSAGITADFVTSTGNATVAGTLDVNGATTLAGVTAEGALVVTDTTESTSTTTGAVTVAGGVGVAKNVNVGGSLDVDGTSTLGNIQVAANEITSTGDVALSATGAVKIGALTMPQTDGVEGAVMVTNGSGVLSLQSVTSTISGGSIYLGAPTTGTLVDNNPAITSFTTTTKVVDAVDKINEVLGRLVPPQPPAFPSGALSITGLSSGLRMADFVQTDNTGQAKSVAGGTTVTAYKRTNTYVTNVFNDNGPGESGTLTVTKNGSAVGSHAVTPDANNNGTFGDLVVSGTQDYGIPSARATGFWYSFDVGASGTVTEGWNGVKISHSAAGTTNEAFWYYDASTPGTPVITQTSFVPTSEVTAKSSSVPHYTSATVWTFTGTVNKLSGDMYPANDNFVTGTAGGLFAAPATVTYAAAGVTTPLTRNLYVSSGSATFTNTTTTNNTTGSSSVGPSVSSNNGYATGSLTATPGGTVLTISTTDATKVNEAKVTVTSVGTGSGNAVRVGGLASGLTPETGTVAAWDNDADLATHEAAVVAGIAAHNTTNYSTGYFPVGPDLSVGRAGTQYITFRLQRAAVSKFNINFTGKVSGCQVAMPGSSLDTTSAAANGWIDATVAYSGAGVPGTGVGGNGSAGCTLGGAITTGTTGSQNKTVTFGTESSTNSTSNYIYVRFALAAGDSITALSFVAATN